MSETNETRSGETLESVVQPQQDSGGALNPDVQPAAYSSFQAMLDAICPGEFAEEFRRRQARPSVRFRNWWAVRCVVWRSKIHRWLSKDTKHDAAG